MCHPHCADNLAEYCVPMSKLDTPVVPPLAKRQKKNNRKSVLVDHPPGEHESSENEQSHNVNSSLDHMAINKEAEDSGNLQPLAKKRPKNAASPATDRKSPQQQKSSKKSQKGVRDALEDGSVRLDLELNSEKTDTELGENVPPLVKRQRKATKKSLATEVVLPRLRSSSKKKQVEADTQCMQKRVRVSWTRGEDNDREILDMDTPKQLPEVTGRDKGNTVIKMEQMTSLGRK